MRQIKAHKDLIAHCGLYCGACQKYLSGKCASCQQNVSATWCQVRKCCQRLGHASCADCHSFSDVSQCLRYNNIFSKIIGLFLRSNRKTCIEKIKGEGYSGFAEYMATKKKRTL